MRNGRFYLFDLPAKYFNNEEESFRYNYRWKIDETNSLMQGIKNISNEIFEQMMLKGKYYNTEDKKAALDCTIINLLASITTGKEIAFPRRYCEYTFPKSYGMRHYTRTNILGTIDGLKNLEYAIQRNGFYNREIEQGKVSRLIPTEKFRDKVDSNLKFSFSKNEFSRFSRDEMIMKILRNGIKKIDFSTPIHLKDKRKNLVEVEKSREVKKMTKFLFDYNNLVFSHAINIPETSFSLIPTIPTIFTTTEPDTRYLYSNISFLPLLEQDISNCLEYINLDCRLYRVFNNGSLRNGGRFYGADSQLLREEQRREIRINGMRTVEIDYQSMHIMMLFHKENIDYQDDPYDAVCRLPALRRPIKKMMQMMINAKTYYKAEGAFKNWLREEPETMDLIYSDGLGAPELMEMISKTHPRIAHYFNSGIGTELQYKDSIIAERILKHFTKQGIACLPVHDSFIVDIKYKDELTGVMKEEYKKIMGFDGRVKVC